MARSFESQRVAGTYLLTGPDGCGRWPLAITFTALLNCERPVRREAIGPMPCGECRNCRLIFALNFEGFYFAVPMAPHKNLEEAIDLTGEVLELKRKEPFAILSGAASLTIPIDVARRIKRDITSRPSEGIHRSIIFYQMERMRPEAADALLKMIEEPPARSVILLIAEKAERLLPTIQSRSQRVALRSSPFDVVAGYLREKYSLPDEKAVLLARTSEGITGRAVQMTDSAEDESSRRVVGFQLFRSLFEENGADTVERMVGSIGERNRGEADYLLHLWQSFVRDCAYIAITGSEDDVVNIDLAPELRRVAEHFADPLVAARLAEQIKITLARLRLNVHIHGALASLVLKAKVDLLRR